MPAATPAPTTLSAFLRERKPEILESWERSVRTIEVARAMARPILLDHVPHVVDRIADLAEALAQGQPPPPPSGAVKAHANARFGLGFDLVEIVNELAILRDEMVRLWLGERLSPERCAEIRPLNQAIDRATADSIEQFTRAHDRTLASLDRVSAAALQTRDVDTLLQHILSVFVEAAEPVDAAVILLHERGALRVLAAKGLDHVADRHLTIAVGEGLAGRAAAEGRPIEASGDELRAIILPDLVAPGTRVAYAVPLTDGRDVIGVAEMSSRTALRFSEQEKRLLHALAERATAGMTQHMLRDQAEEARRRAELEQERLRQVLDALPVGVWIADESGQIVTGNPASRAIWGGARFVPWERFEQYEGRWAATGKRIAADEWALTRAIRRGETSLDEEVEIRTFDGRTRFIRNSAFPLRAQGRIVGAIAVNEDVTERRRLEREGELLLRRVEFERSRLSRVIEHIPAGVLIADAKTGRLSSYNAEAERIWRDRFDTNRPVEMQRRGRLFHPDGRPYESGSNPLARALRAGEVIHGEELQIARGDGTRGTVVVNAIPLRDEDGTIVAALLALMDISERKEYERELAADAEFGERLLGVLAHDLRNPLQAIMLTAQAFVHRTDMPDAHLRAVTRILSSAHRIDRMIADIADFTRGRLGGGIPIVPKPTELGEVCRLVIDELEVTHPDQPIQLDCARDARGTWDPDRLAQVISNLTANALHHGDPKRPVRITLDGDSHLLRLAIHNDGTPIPPDTVAHIFDPFRRATEEAGRGASGLGLGLYIVREIVDAHGGAIDVRSSAEEGTTFTVTLPRTAARLTCARPQKKERRSP